MRIMESVPMTDRIHNSQIPNDKKLILIQLIQSMLNDVNKQVAHLGINNYTKLQEEISNLLVPIVEDSLN